MFKVHIVYKPVRGLIRLSSNIFMVQTGFVIVFSMLLSNATSNLLSWGTIKLHT